jgi:hypothetical protein
MKLSEKFQIDLLRDHLGWEVYEELEALLDRIYAQQDRGERPDLSELKEIGRAFYPLWDEMLALEPEHKHHPVFQSNQEVLLLTAMVLWGATFCLKDLDPI